MKLKILMMLIILGLLSVTPMIYMGRFDPTTFFEGGGGEIQRLRAKAPKNLSSVVTDKRVQVYQWRDKNGVMQYSNTPPMDMPSKQVTLNPDSNVIQATKRQPEQVEVKKTPGADEAPRPYSVSGMKKVINDARQVEELLQKRHEQQQKKINNF